MSILVVALGAEFFVKSDGRRIPFQNLKINSLKTAPVGNFGDMFEHQFADAPTAKIFCKINIFEINSALTAKGREIGKENRVTDCRFVVKRDNRLGNFTFAEKLDPQAFFRYLKTIEKIFIFRKFAQKCDDLRNIFGRGFFNFHLSIYMVRED